MSIFFEDTVSIGVIYAIAASFLSGFNSAFLQGSLQKGGRNSFVLTAELSTYGNLVFI